MAAASTELRTVSKALALVTGGASGLGKATVARLVRQGARVVIADLSSSNGNQVAKEIGGNACFIATDVSNAIYKFQHL